MSMHEANGMATMDIKSSDVCEMNVAMYEHDESTKVRNAYGTIFKTQITQQ